MKQLTKSEKVPLLTPPWRQMKAIKICIFGLFEMIEFCKVFRAATTKTEEEAKKKFWRRKKMCCSRRKINLIWIERPTRACFKIRPPIIKLVLTHRGDVDGRRMTHKDEAIRKTEPREPQHVVLRKENPLRRHIDALVHTRNITERHMFDATLSSCNCYALLRSHQ